MSQDHARDTSPVRTRGDAAGSAGEPGARSVAAYFDAFSPAPRWEELPTWPPDVFAFANLVLDHTEAYRFAVAPPAGRRWPPSPGWNEQVREAAQQWRSLCAGTRVKLPELVRDCWAQVTLAREVSLAEVRNGSAWELCDALLTLHAVADEACADLAVAGQPVPGHSFEARAWAMLEQRGSLSHLSPTRVRIVPKTHFAARGITIRSLSRYLALCYESVEVRWRRVEPGAPGAPGAAGGRQTYNVLLAPWPLSVSADDFRPVRSPLANMDTDVFGFFEFAPRPALDVTRVRSLLEVAHEQVGTVNALILPEAAVEPDEVTALERVLASSGADFLVAGVRERPSTGAFGRNYVHFGVRTAAGWQRYQQDKHHRWCLDDSQIRQYHLTRALDPRKLWWEAIDIPERTLHVINVGGATAAPLVCEDLARLDEVADLVRRIGPSLVVAVLLDGPQLTTRWPCRYAGVLGDEPGSAVLTLTALGMAARSRPPGMRPSRVVALWNDGTGDLRELELRRGADGILLTVDVEGRTAWTADGRCHHDVPSLVLADIHQLRSSA